MSQPDGVGRFRGLSPRAPADVLLALAELASRSPAPRLPRVRLSVASGATFEGIVMGTTAHPGGHAVLLRSEEDAVSYVDLGSAFGLTVLDASAFLHVLRFGDVPRWSCDPPLTALALRRVLAECETKLRALGLSLDARGTRPVDQGLANNVVRDVAMALCAHLESTKADPLGASAIEALATVALVAGPGVSGCTHRDGNVLTVELSTDAGLGDKGELFAEIDRAL